jgi:uncharacterized protein with HEPN domain
MLQSAELIVTYTDQCSKAEFVGNLQLQDAVIRRLLVIAEAREKFFGRMEFAAIQSKSAYAD